MDLALKKEDEAFASSFRGWLAEHPHEPPAFVDLADEVAWGKEWQAALAADRWVGVHWPSEYGGRSATPVQVALYQSEYARSRAPQPVNRVGINLVGPTLLAHGTEDQRLRYMPRILSAEEIWCQLFSEPDAGSDLASLTTRGTPVDGGYLVTGRKVWTSYAQFATWGLCLARTDPEATRPQQGITALIVDMADPGVEVRPLVQMTGDTEFNEVFLTDVFVPAEHVIGVEGQGWTVAGSTLAHERGTNFPFKEQVVHEMYLSRLYDDARDNGTLDDPLVADALAHAYVDLNVLRLHNLRTLTRLGRGEEPGPESSWIKLTWTSMTQGMSDAALMVTGRDPASAEAGPWARQWLWSKAASIAGGTSQVQRDIIAGRILGLPR
ncbi:MAG TPA: acyl-CoA dehydrogenase family protein [Acidimicrobiales bacterium]|nr:acyl-CoA dehydrogenase family protein [Acidimicrobiales bacterium]